MTTEDMSDPRTRAAMAERMTPDEYNRAMEAWHDQNTVATVNGYPIRRTPTRYGVLFAIVGAAVAYASQAEAEAQAAKMPKGPRA